MMGVQDVFKLQEVTVQVCDAGSVLYIQYCRFVVRLRYQFNKKVYQYSNLLERSIICRSGL
jgi:hypothetical protein